jgi:hypothetical protein
MEIGLFIIMLIGAIVAIETTLVIYGLGLLGLAAVCLTLLVGGLWPAGVQSITIVLSLYLLNQYLLAKYKPPQGVEREPLSTLIGVIFIVLAFWLSLRLLNYLPAMSMGEAAKLRFGDILAALFVLGLVVAAAKHFLTKGKE